MPTRWRQPGRLVTKACLLALHSVAAWHTQGTLCHMHGMHTLLPTQGHHPQRAPGRPHWAHHLHKPQPTQSAEGLRGLHTVWAHPDALPELLHHWDRPTWDLWLDPTSPAAALPTELCLSCGFGEFLALSQL